MRYLIMPLLATGALVLSIGPAHAEDITWTGDGDGTSFGDPLNWSPTSVPGQFDTAIFNIGFPLVTLGRISVENERLSVVQFGDGTLHLNGNSYSLLGFGPPSIEVEGSVTISDGQLFSTNEALIHPSGSIALSDLEWVHSGRLDIQGSLLIENSAEVDSGSGRIGQEGGRLGTVTVTGFDSAWEIGGGQLDIGPGNLTISAGGSVFSHEALIAPSEKGGDGSVLITGAGSSWINTGPFILGVFGSGALDIADGGMMLSGSGFLGLFAGSSGTVTVDGPGSTWINLSDLFVGDFGSGTLNITNGGSVSNTAGFVGSFAGSSGTAIVDGPGSTWTNLVSLAVGNFGTGSLTVSNGGTVAALQITVTGAGEVHGDGTLVGNVTNSSGLISPGLPIGTLNIQGDYLQNPSAVLDIKLSASGGGRLAITGQAEPVYPTLMLSVVSGDQPCVGQMFTILTAAHISGQNFTVIDDGGQYDVTKSSTDIVVTVVALFCQADVDGDGTVGVKDLLSLLGSWGPCKVCPGDFDCDGNLDVSDLLALLGNWGPCP